MHLHEASTPLVGKLGVLAWFAEGAHTVLPKIELEAEEMMGIEVHDQYWPLMIEIYQGKATPRELEEHRNKMRIMVAQGERYGLFYDLRGAEAESLEERKKDAELIRELASEVKRLCIGCAFVVSNPIIRITMNFILFLAPPPMPYKVVPRIEDGHVWLSEQFHIAGISYPPGADDFLRSLEEAKAA